MKFKAVIFDFDGVFTNSIPVHDEAYKGVFSKLGVSVALEQLHSYIGSTPKQVLAAVVNNSAEVALKEFNSYLMEKYSQLDLSPNLDHLLQSLKKKDYLIGVASSTDSTILRIFLQKHNLLDLIDSLIGGEVLEKGKPDPEMIVKCLEILKVEPKQAIAIDDARSGIIAAKSLGMFTIAYTGYSDKEVQEADLNINDFRAWQPE